MANYTESVLLTAQALLAERYAAPEMRHQNYNITRILLENAGTMVPDVDTLKTSDQRAVEAYAFIKSASDAVTARAAAHEATAFGDSQKVELTWATKGQKFKSSLKSGGRNMFSQAQMLANRMESAWIHLLDTLETTNAAYLAAGKTQVNGATASELGEFDTTEHIWKIEAEKKAWYFQYVQMMMAINNYRSSVDVICDPVIFAIAQQVANQGSGNNLNTSFQFAGMDLSLSTGLAAETGYIGYNYALPKGTAGMLTWIPTENRQNIETRLQTYTTMNDPFGLGITAALHVRETAADTHGTVGERQDEVVEFELSVDIAGVKAPLSVSNETTIFKTGLLNPVTAE